MYEKKSVGDLSPEIDHKYASYKLLVALLFI